MVQLRRDELRRLLTLTDELLEVTVPTQLGPVLLRGLSGVVGGDAAFWHEVDVRPPVREVVVGWPPDRFTLDLAERAAPVLETHPLIGVHRVRLNRGEPPSATARLSEYASRRQWHETPLYREAIPDVDDQVLLITAARGPVVQFISVERQGRSFTVRDQAVLAAVAQHVRAATTRARRAPHAAMQTAPVPLWKRLDPRLATPAVVQPDPLTPRQRQVLSLVASGLTDAQAARRLGTSTRTVSKHLQRIYATLEVSGRVAAIRSLRSASDDES